MNIRKINDRTKNMSNNLAGHSENLSGHDWWAAVILNPANINFDCMFKININKLESTLCNDCGHTTNNDGVCIDWSLRLEDSSNLQTIRGCYISLWIQGENTQKITDVLMNIKSWIHQQKLSMSYSYLMLTLTTKHFQIYW